MKRKILMLSGRINSGKDYTANLLVRHSMWIKMTFAEHLKDYTSKQFNIPLDDLYTQEGKNKIHETSNKSYRQILIETARRLKENNPDYFVNKLIQKVRTTDSTCNIVISDFRYPNEYSKVLECLANDFEIITAKVHRIEEVNF